MKLEFVFFLACTIVSCSLVVTFTHWFAFWATGVKVSEATFFRGPIIAKFDFRGTVVRIKAVPIDSSVRYDLDSLKTRPLVVRLLPSLAGLVVLSAAAVALLGMTRGEHESLAGFKQIVSGAIHPRTVGASLVDKMYHEYLTSAANAAGIYYAKLLSVMLLPMGGTAVGQIAYQLLSALGMHELADPLFTVSALAMWAIWGAWLIATVQWLV